MMISVMTFVKYLWSIAMNNKTMEKVYMDAQKACGLKVGDWVKITRKAEDYEAGWNNTWDCTMDEYANQVGQIMDINDEGIEVQFIACWDSFPYFVLEKVEKSKHEFKPFEQVLVRDMDNEIWQGNIVSYIDYDGDPVCIVDDYWKQVIPYKGNEHLVGTTEEPKVCLKHNTSEW